MRLRDSDRTFWVRLRPALAGHVYGDELLDVVDAAARAALYCFMEYRDIRSDEEREADRRLCAEARRDLREALGSLERRVAGGETE